MTDEPRYHPKSIASGYAIVPYASATITTSGVYCPAGWCLPGGARTAVESVARAVADSMDRAIREAKA